MVEKNWQRQWSTSERSLVMPAKKKETKQRLDPSCWKGYEKKGTKVKGGTRVNNCVKKKK